MEVFEDKESMRAWSKEQKLQGSSVALVPTMGYLHDGHLALVREAKALGDRVVVSIYVNPSQFGPTEDLDVYPRDVAGDLEKLRALEVSAVFTPKDLYNRTVGPWGAAHETWVTVERLQQPLCGKGRPGFFRGVATVVTKLFNIVEPDVAVFGKKDYQQFQVIRQLVVDLDIPVRVVGAPLVREPDGLAMSSRNVRLTPDERKQALSISQALFEAKRRVEELGASGLQKLEWENERHRLLQQVMEKISASGGRVEYAEVVHAQTLDITEDSRMPSVLAVAAFVGSVRLIDNVEINVQTHNSRAVKS